MAEPRLLRTEEIAIARIEVGARLRPASPAAVDAIAASIVAAGAMIQPVAVREKDGRLILMGGLHRLRAAERLRRDTVRAEVWECQDQFARLFEVHENLAGAELSTLELAQFLHEAKAAYEQMNPQTKQGVAGALARHGYASGTVPFAETIAEKRGCSASLVQKLSRIGGNLDRAAADDLRLVGRQPTHRELAAISSLTVEQQRLAAESWAAGLAKDGVTAAKLAKGGPVDDAERVDQTEAELRKLVALWSKTSKAGRDRFLRHLREQAA
jgi:ParB family transcriptional regulator, chromosome partitioning protein